MVWGGVRSQGDVTSWVSGTLAHSMSFASGSMYLYKRDNICHIYFSRVRKCSAEDLDLGVSPFDETMGLL